MGRGVSLRPVRLLAAKFMLRAHTDRAARGPEKWQLTVNLAQYRRLSATTEISGRICDRPRSRRRCAEAAIAGTDIEDNPRPSIKQPAPPASPPGSPAITSAIEPTHPPTQPWLPVRNLDLQRISPPNRADRRLSTPTPQVQHPKGRPRHPGSAGTPGHPRTPASPTLAAVGATDPR